MHRCDYPGCEKQATCSWQSLKGRLQTCAEHQCRDWSPESHLGVLTDRPWPASGKIIPGKSRRIKRK
jgi:hypothetical protein